MPLIDDAWRGDVQFYELVFGTWLAYGFLVLTWQVALRQPLEEWRYVLITFLGASFFWVNHYFQRAPFYALLLNGYALVFWVAWYQVAVRGWRRSLAWKVAATLAAVAFTVAYILFEQIARVALERYAIQEFWIMLAAYFGFLLLIFWRRASSRRGQPG